MIDPNISQREKDCVRILAKFFERGATSLTSAFARFRAEGLELEARDYEPLMRMMESYGVISNSQHGANAPFFLFTITADSLRIAREIDALERKAQEPKDIVAVYQQKARKHPVVAFIIIAVIAFSVLVNAIHGAIQLGRDIGLIKPASSKAPLMPLADD